MMATLFLFLFLASTVSASTCPVNVPFSSSLVGRSHSMTRPCMGRFIALSSVSVSSTEIRYQPFQEDFNHGGVNPGYVCRQQYIFKLRRNAPILVELPRLVIPEDIDRNSDYCEREQAAQQITSGPSGPTMNRYIAGLNATIDGIRYLRDHECRTTQYLPFLYSEEYLNGWLDSPMTYLLGVAYRLGLCLHV